MVEQLEVFFDYTCEYAYRAHQWLALVEANVTWRPFSLLELNHRGDGPSVWRVAENADEISLLLFAAHEWVLADGGDVDNFRQLAFSAWHDGKHRLGNDDVVSMALAAGARGGNEPLRAHFFTAEAEHEVARQLGVFGSPTLVFGPDEAAFVKLDKVPSPERAVRMLDAVATMSELPSLIEVKRPIPPVDDDDERGATS